jgi:hypothetical protein
MKALVAIVAVSLSASAFGQVNRATAPVPTPRSQPIGPVGPGSVNNPPVVPAPNIGPTFDRSLIGGPPPGVTPISPDASVPTFRTPTPGTRPVTPNGILGNSPVTVTNTGLPGSFSTNVIGGAGGIAGSPARVPNFVTPPPAFVRPMPREPVTVFNFPPGSTIISNALPPITGPNPVLPVIPPVGSPGGVQTGRGTATPLAPVPPVRVPPTPVRPVVPSTSSGTTR